MYSIIVQMLMINMIIILVINFKEHLIIKYFITMTTQID
jgi:hypothetical protein